MTQGLLLHLPEDEVKGVLAHEFGHIKNRDILVSTIAAMLLQLAVSRQREYLADALATLERGAQAIPMQVNPAAALAVRRELAAPAGSDHPVDDPSPAGWSGSRARAWCSSCTIG